MLLLPCIVGLSIAACAPQTLPVQLRFTVDDASEVHALSFYIHDVDLIAADGSVHRLELANRERWQNERVALLDLVDEQRDVVEGRAPDLSYISVRFAVGVPFDLNHVNPLTATAPLDRGDMFWSWQSGYKFLRIDLSAGEHDLAFHLGSTGCSSASALRPPQDACAQPNKMRVELTGFDPLAQPIEIQVRQIVAALSDGQVRACTGDYSSEACVKAFAVTGLDAKTGLCGASTESGTCSAQRLFVPAKH